jgi:hypothetical protein
MNEEVSLMDQVLGMVSNPETIAMIVGGVATVIAGSKIGGTRFKTIKRVLVGAESALHTINEALAEKEE